MSEDEAAPRSEAPPTPATDEGPERLAPPASAAPSRAQSLVPHAALLLSGAAALVYESGWGRQLQRLFGVSDLASATVLAAYFLGLGLGGALGDRLARRARDGARTYALLEVAIAGLAVLSLPLLAGLHGLYGRVGAGASFGALTALRLGLAMLVLLPPTVLMGATMPLLVAALRSRSASWSETATGLYVTNTLGAALGAGLTGFVLLPRLGARASLLLAALGSAAAAALVRYALPPATRAAEDPSEPVRGDAPDAPPREGGHDASAPRPWLVPLLAASAGLLALGSEVLWTRVVRTVIEGTTRAFSSMLVVFLLGIVLGSFVARALLRRGLAPLRAFAYAQGAAALGTAFAVLLTPQLPRLIALLRGSDDLIPTELWLILLLAAVLLGPLALATGATVPLLWAAAAREGGPQVGRVLAANTFGGLAGSLATGFALVPTLGIDATCAVFFTLFLASAAVAARASAGERLGERVLTLLVPASLATLFGLTTPSVELPYLIAARLGGASAVVSGPGPEWRARMVYLREGRNTTVSLLRDVRQLSLANDGRPESGFNPTPVGFGPELVLLGALPGLFAERTDRAMVIGLGAGHTTTVLLAAGFGRVDAVELEPAVVEAARLLHRAFNKSFPLDDPRARLLVDDARNQLVLAAPQSYDAIVSQPSHPWLEGSSALYTREFVDEARRALRPGGVLSLWVNLFRTDVPHVQMIVRTLHERFPHMVGFVAEGSSLVLNASGQPLRATPRLAQRLGRPELRFFLHASGLDTVSGLFAHLELDAPAARAFAADAPVLTDDRPALEFDLSRLSHRSVLTANDLDQALQRAPWISEDTLAEVPPEARLALAVERTRHAGPRPAALQRVQLAGPVLAASDAARATLLGALAQERGDASGALALYDRAEHPAAQSLADRLRLREGLAEQVLARVEQTGRVGSPGAALTAAAAALDAARTTALLARLPAALPPEGSALRALVTTLRAHAEGGCTAALAALDAGGANPRGELDELEALAALRVRCLGAGSSASLEQLRAASDALGRARRALASSYARPAADADRFRNDAGAAALYRAALRFNPVLAPAATGLARVLLRAQRREEAAAVLAQTLRAAAGLSATQAALLRFAHEQSLELPAELTRGAGGGGEANSGGTRTVPSASGPGGGEE